jgi:hypothetical protein
MLVAMNFVDSFVRGNILYCYYLVALSVKSQTDTFTLYRKCDNFSISLPKYHGA